MVSNVIDMNTPWYKQFWPWFLIFLPASVVVACMFTIYLAVTNADSLVVDDYSKKAMHINRDLRKIEYARGIGLSGSFSIQNNILSLDVSVQKNKITLAPVLNMLLVHPTDSKKDFSVVLIRAQESIMGAKNEPVEQIRYVSRKNDQQVNLIHEGAWYVRLMSPDNVWQLNGKVKGNKKTILLYAD